MLFIGLCRKHSQILNLYRFFFLIFILFVSLSFKKQRHTFFPGVIFDSFMQYFHLFFEHCYSQFLIFDFFIFNDHSFKQFC